MGVEWDGMENASHSFAREFVARTKSMELDSFLKLPGEELARIVRTDGPKVCVFPINGTRRWFALEYDAQGWSDPVTAYMDIAGKNHVGLFRLFFDHGIDTLITPVFGPDLLLRGDEYLRRIGADGLARLAEHPDFLIFYDEYDVRVHFYGDYRRIFAGSELEHLSDLFDTAAERTSSHKRFHLFFGVFANDATQSVAEFSAHHYQNQGRVPEKRDLIEMYYGEYVEPVDLFIGFDRFSAFDMPLLTSGEEDLYFTISPSPYMTQAQLRSILYDHLFVRRSREPEYASFSKEQMNDLRNFYSTHHEQTLGTGTLLHGVWIPELGKAEKSILEVNGDRIVNTGS